LSPAHLYLAATEDTSVQTLMTALCMSSYFHHVSVGYINSLRERVCCGLWYAALVSICESAQYRVPLLVSICDRTQYRVPYHTNMSVCHSAKHWQIAIMAAKKHHNENECAYRDFLFT